MPTPEQVVVSVCVLCAALYVARRVFRALRPARRSRQGDCGTKCGGC